MPHVVLPHYCADARCVAVYPVDCVHPAPGEPGFAEADMLHIDPAMCIDCGACADVRPVDAVVTDYFVPRDSPVVALNAGRASPWV